MPDAPVLGPINQIADRATAGDFERKHTPYIEVTRHDDGTLTATVTVGWDVPHPNQPDHYITWIELYASGAPIARFDFVPAVSWPVVSVKLALDQGTVLRAVEHCNLHGLWASEITV
ncbi:MAG: class II SORL domain-containing protein [Coriobacteriia bacterium]|nr:class II SORL domain-containing protein [Coriobacteriia bacterium]